MDVPFKLGELETTLKVSVVDANIPLLIGLNDLKKLKLELDFDEDKIKSKRTGEEFQLVKTPQGHLAIPFISRTIDDDDTVLLLDSDNHKAKLKKIQRIHHVMCHPKPHILKNFFRDSSTNDEETLRIAEEVFNNCKVCKFKYKKSPPCPKVSLPVSNDFNHCVSVHLKGPWNKKYILYCVDTFS